MQKLYAALVAAQKKAQGVAKDSLNTFHRYKYASAEAIIEEARGALASAGLAVFSVGWEVFPATPEDPFGYVEVKYRVVHESGETMELGPTETAVVPDKGRPQDKAEATALTYNLGYFLRGLLLLPREDAEAAVDARDDRAHTPPVKSNGKEKVDPAEKLAAEIAAALEKGFATALEKTDWKALHRDEINSLPVHLKARIVDAFEKAKVRQ